MGWKRNYLNQDNSRYEGRAPFEELAPHIPGIVARNAESGLLFLQSLEASDL